MRSGEELINASTCLLDSFGRKKAVSNRLLPGSTTNSQPAGQDLAPQLWEISYDAL
jgi:hypothetical protein